MQGAGQLYYLKLKRKLPPPHFAWGGGGCGVLWCGAVRILGHQWPCCLVIPYWCQVIALVFGPSVVIWCPSTHCPSHISTPSDPTSSGSWQWLGVWL